MEEKNNEEIKEVLEQLKQEESKESIEDCDSKKRSIKKVILRIVEIFLLIVFLCTSTLSGCILCVNDNELFGIICFVLPIVMAIGVEKGNKIIKKIFKIIVVIGIIGMLLGIGLYINSHIFRINADEEQIIMNVE